ncbi:hypothetical protein BAMBUS_00800 [Brevundimonas phage vB_BpoS-Bambus]|nr:hypothetical protein BAMBUS_00800 [Brevundimonas phage vB_BpoS-Bambus]
MTDTRTLLGWVRNDRHITWWGADYPVHWEPGEGFAIYGEPGQAQAQSVAGELPASPSIVALQAYCVRQAESNDDDAVRYDEDAADWAENPDSNKAKRAESSRVTAASCRTAAAKFRMWARALDSARNAEVLRDALLECQDKLWIARCDSGDEKFRAAAERACDMATEALKAAPHTPAFKDEAALKATVKDLITHRRAGDYDLMADDVANALWPILCGAAGRRVDQNVNDGLLRSAIGSAITDAVFEALEVDGENVSSSYGKVWDACNAAADMLKSGSCPQVHAPDRPYMEAIQTPALLRSADHLFDLIAGGLFDHPHKSAPVGAIRLLTDDLWTMIGLQAAADQFAAFRAGWRTNAALPADDPAYFERCTAIDWMDYLKRGVAAYNARLDAAAQERETEAGQQGLRDADAYKAATEALEKCWGALNFVLAFYDPGQRHLDTNAWKQAEAGARRAHAHARVVLDELKIKPEDEENPWRTQTEWSDLLRLRDDFIVNEGLWAAFTDTLERQVQLSGNR